MPMRRFSAAILLAAALAGAAPAAACMLRPGERPANTLEMAVRAELVLIGRIVSGPRIYDHDGPRMVVEPLQFLKGRLPRGRLIELAASTRPPDRRLHSNPNELVYAHPQAFAGMCVRTVFARNSTVLFFLNRSGDGYAGLWPPFSRFAEDVPSSNSLWVRVVRMYLEVAALPAAERRAALLARQAELRARTRDRQAAAIVADIDRHLAALPAG